MAFIVCADRSPQPVTFIGETTTFEAIFNTPVHIIQCNDISNALDIALTDALIPNLLRFTIEQDANAELWRIRITISGKFDVPSAQGYPPQVLISSLLLIVGGLGLGAAISTDVISSGGGLNKLVWAAVGVTALVIAFGMLAKKK